MRTHQLVAQDLALAHAQRREPALARQTVLELTDTLLDRRVGALELGQPILELRDHAVAMVHVHVAQAEPLP